MEPIATNLVITNTTTIAKKDFYIAWTLGIAVTIGFIFWRYGTVLVWNDTSCWMDLHPIFSLHSVSQLLKISFETIDTGYRPLSYFIASIGTIILNPYQSLPLGWLLMVGAIYGTLASSYYYVAKRFLKNEWAALFAVFLVMFSPSVISASWVIFAGLQPIVSLIICLGLLLYWKIIETKSRKILYTILLYTLMFIGPWFREFTGLLPLLIIFLEISRTHRFTARAFISLTFFMHALYPTAIPIFLGIHNLPLKPVFEYGALNGQLTTNSDILANAFKNMRWEVSSVFIFLFPPLLIILAATAPLINAFHYLKKIQPNYAILGLIFATPLLLLAAKIGFHHPYFRFMLPFFICLGIALISLRKNPFLSFWFLLSFLPFLKIYTEIVHLAYALLPASIILMSSVQNLWEKIANLKSKLGSTVKIFFTVIMTIVFLDQASIAYGSYQVIKATYGGILNVGNWFEKHIPQGSLVVGNVTHNMDIQLYSRNYFQSFTTVAAGWGRPPDTILQDPQKFSTFLHNNLSKKPIYLLDIDFNYLPEQADGHRNKYVHLHQVPNRDLGVIYETKVYYPYFDPLRKWIPRNILPFLGAPDFAQDFYIGPAENGKPFLYEVNAKYHLYKVIGSKLTLSPEAQNKLINNSIQLKENGYKTFNIAYSSITKKYYGLGQSEGAFDYQKIKDKKYKYFVEGNSINHVKQKIDNFALKTNF